MPSRPYLSIRPGSAWSVLLLVALLACSPPVKRRQRRGVLPGNASALDYIELLDAQDQLLALPRTVDGYSSFLDRHPKSTNLPRLADFKAESVLALQPSLVLSDSTQSPETRKYLTRAGIQVLLLVPFRQLKDGKINLRAIAKALDLDAEPVIRRLERRERDLRATQTKVEQAPKILPWTWYGESHWSAGTGTGADYALRLAGAENQARSLGLQGHAEIPIELILDSDPDALLVRDQVMLTRLKAHPRLKQLRCLEKSRVIILQPSLASCNSPYLIDAAVEIRRQLRALGLL